MMRTNSKPSTYILKMEPHWIQNAEQTSKTWINPNKYKIIVFGVFFKSLNSNKKKTSLAYMFMKRQLKIQNIMHSHLM